MNPNEKTKKELLEILEKNPIIQPAVERCGISRATYYRWRTKDKSFTEKADQAISEGRILVSELCESKLITAIRNENLGAIKFYLTHNDSRYSDKLQITGDLKTESKTLTPEQEESIKHALLLCDIDLKGVEDDDTK